MCFSNQNTLRNIRKSHNITFNVLNYVGMVKTDRGSPPQCMVSTIRKLELKSTILEGVVRKSSKGRGGVRESYSGRVGG